ncbi:group II intron reverse transcriptase/maturase [Pirellula sp. SH-Sr6A]|uniref:group II intron reverse transcriptase/maturase n=1 Tax=Pirellula sp. SH-Sr6A TaxID=1632865 RepID=UPI001F0A38BD|nr:group II intron reverse transcriptase/maturase [Pirellula sp. SH-Sr6A]
MKNKEEPSIDLPRGNHSMPGDPSLPESVRMETAGSTVRTDDAATASIEKPALSLFPMSLMEALVENSNIELAWKNVKANRGASGPDGITITEFPAWFRPRWHAIRQQLLDGTCQPNPVRRVSIDKPDGGKRLLGIPNLVDRLIQQAIVQILTPLFDPSFSESSFGFRPKRSAHGAAKQVRRTIRRGYRYAVDMDLSKFFDRVGHDLLMSRVARKVHDKAMLQLIGRYLRAGVIVDGQLHATTEGTPQGGPASPLLANILLDDLDKELEQRGLRFVRYTDDFVIFTRSKRSAERVFESVHRYLTRKLHLVVNLEKSRIVSVDQLEYLGFIFTGLRATINVSAQSIHKFKHRIREITGRSRGISMAHRLKELARYVRGWMGYFALASQLKLFASLEQWIRRRIRCCYWKRWRRVRTRIRNLVALGGPRRQAIRHGKSRKGPWHMSKTIASGVGLTNAWLAAQGVLSMKTLWAELAHLR